MKKNLVKSLAFTFLILNIGFLACEEKIDYTAQLIQQEIDDREAYIEAEGISDSSKTASGLYYIETKEGTGVQATAGNVVKVNYQGELLNGFVFDSTWDEAFSHKEPYVFTLGTGAVIAGWDEAIALMKEGGTAKLIIPSELAYGANGKGGSIPPYTTLVFYVELVDVE